MQFDRSATTVVVFSHPNHELAIFGMLQDVKPSIVYLTDGGGEDRLAQTREGLGRIGLLERATFLNFTEQSFYDALLDRDAAFWKEVASRLRAALETLKPAQVLCDAVEFYNPVHDMSLPLVRAALGASDAKVFEIPLVYEMPAKAESYEVQRAVASHAGDQVAFSIPEPHVDQKVRARDEVYSILTKQLGPVITEIPRSHLGTEVIFPAQQALASPDPAKALRYERRARLLLERGEIQRMITYAEHYVPVAGALLARGASAQA